MEAVIRNKRLEFWQIPIMLVVGSIAFLARNLARPILQLNYGDKISKVVYILFHSKSNAHIFVNIVAPAALDLICCAGVLWISAYHLYTIRDSETLHAVLKGALVALLGTFLLILAYQSLVLFSVAFIGMLIAAMVVMVIVSALRRT